MDAAELPASVVVAAGPLEVVMGLPTHVLVVHGVVVLVPLTALGVLAVVLSRTWRARLRGLVVALATVATVLTFVAARSGAELRDRFALETDPLVSDHQAYGESARWWVLLMWVLLVAWALLGKREEEGAVAPDEGGRGVATGTRTSVGAKVLAGLLVASAVLATTQVVLTGHSGSQATWERQVDATER